MTRGMRQLIFMTCVFLLILFQTSHGFLAASTVTFGPHTNPWSVVGGASVWREVRGGRACVSKDSVDHYVMDSRQHLYTTFT